MFVGPFKCGSTSVGAALTTLGYDTLGWHPQLLTDAEYVTIRALNAYVGEYASIRDIPPDGVAGIRRCAGRMLERAMEGRDAACDYPMGHDALHPLIRKIVFPDAKFVFLMRDMDAYVRSVERHTPAGSDPTHDAIWDVRAFGRQVAWQQYGCWRASYERLQRDFPRDVLFMRVDDGWTPLVEFLASDVPEDVLRAASSKPFPWENRTEGRHE